MSHSPPLAVKLSDSDILKLVQEYLETKRHHISLLSLERETGIINGNFSEDALFLRQLIVDGQWEDTLDFIQPLVGMEGFDDRTFTYTITKHKYLELLCLKSDPGPMQHHDFTLEEVVSTLNTLETLCPSKNEYHTLCFLLTLPSISDHDEYKEWNPSSARLQCFSLVFPLIERFVPIEKPSSQQNNAAGNRLVQLLVKGLLYETCVQYCQQRAVGSPDHSVVVPQLLGGPLSLEADLSLLSWLQSIPQSAFACRFEKKALKLKHLGFHKPELEAVWSEQILSTPFKPNQFPYSAVPSRTRPAEALSRSLMLTHIGGSATGNSLASSLLGPSTNVHSALSTGLTAAANRKVSPISRSYAGAFHLTRSLVPGSTAMTQSVERLFERARLTDTEDPVTPNNHKKESSILRKNTFKVDGRGVRPDSLQEPLSPKLEQTFLLDEHSMMASPANAEVPPINVGDSSDSSENTTPRPSHPDSGDIITPVQQLSNASKVEPHPSAAITTSVIASASRSSARVSHPDPMSTSVCGRLCVVPPQTASEPVVMTRHSAHTAMPSPMRGEGLPIITATPRHSSMSSTGYSNGEKGDVNPKQSGGSSGLPSNVMRSEGRSVGTSDLFASYQQHRTRMKEEMAAEEKRREERWKQLLDTEGGPELSVFTTEQQQRMEPVPVGSSTPRTELATVTAVGVDAFREPTAVAATASPSVGDSITRLPAHIMDSSNTRQPALAVANVSPVAVSHHPISQSTSFERGLPGAFCRVEVEPMYESPGDFDGMKSQTKPAAVGVPKIQYVAVSSVEDQQAIRAVAFSPSGMHYAVGSNSKVLRVCPFPDLRQLGDLTRQTLSSPHRVSPAAVVAKRIKHHKGSIYCAAWNTSGSVIATGSNDKSVKVIQFGSSFNGMLGSERELSTHDGTVRDVTFLSESILVSGGAGTNYVAVTDCETGQIVRILYGHTAPILSVHTAGEGPAGTPTTGFVTGSSDCSARFWDIRTGVPISVVRAPQNPGDEVTAFASVCVEGSGRVLASGHESGHCLMYDIRANRLLKQWQPHSADTRAVRFSPVGAYLLSGSYDSLVKLADLCGAGVGYAGVGGNRTVPSSVVVAEHTDKVIQVKWHPDILAFVSTSADRTAKCWCIPV